MSVVLEQSFVPILLEKIFQQYTQIFETPEQPVVPPFHPRRIDPRLRKFFYELKSILSEEIVQRAVRLLDEQHSITIYQLEDLGREFAVITEGRRAKRKLHLFPYVNYCSCNNFKRYVLGVKDIPDMANTASKFSSAATSNYTSGKKEHYTCEHVLALRLATIFKSPCLRIEILPKERFNLHIRQTGYSF